MVELERLSVLGVEGDLFSVTCMGAGGACGGYLSMDLAWHFRETQCKVAGHRNGQMGCGKEAIALMEAPWLSPFCDYTQNFPNRDGRCAATVSQRSAGNPFVGVNREGIERGCRYHVRIKNEIVNGHADEPKNAQADECRNGCAQHFDILSNAVTKRRGKILEEPFDSFSRHNEI